MAMANQNLRMVEMTEEHRKFSVDLDQTMGALIDRNPSIGLDELIIFFARYVASLAESIGMGEYTQGLKACFTSNFDAAMAALTGVHPAPDDSAPTITNLN